MIIKTGSRLVASRQITITGKGPGVAGSAIPKGAVCDVISPTTDGGYTVRLAGKDMIVNGKWLEANFKPVAESAAAPKETDRRGSQVQSMEDGTDHKDPDDDHYAESKQVPPKETDRRGSQVQSMEDADEHPHSGGPGTTAGKVRIAEDGTVTQLTDPSPTIDQELGGEPETISSKEKEKDEGREEVADEHQEEGDMEEAVEQDKEEDAAEEISLTEAAKQFTKALAKNALDILRGKGKKKKAEALVIKGVNINSEVRIIAKDVLAMSDSVNRDDVLRALGAAYGPFGKESKKVASTVDVVLAELKKDPEVGSRVIAESAAAPKETDKRGYQGDTSEDATDHSDPDDAHYDESNRVSPKETDSKGSQVVTMEDAEEHPHSGGGAATAGKKDSRGGRKVQAGGADQAMDYLIAEMEKGVSFEQAHADAEAKFNVSVPQDEGTVRKASRRKRRARMMASVAAGRRADQKKKADGEPEHPPTPTSDATGGGKEEGDEIKPGPSKQTTSEEKGKKKSSILATFKYKRMVRKARAEAKKIKAMYTVVEIDASETGLEFEGKVNIIDPDGAVLAAGLTKEEASSKLEGMGIDPKGPEVYWAEGSELMASRKTGEHDGDDGKKEEDKEEKDEMDYKKESHRLSVLAANRASEAGYWKRMYMKLRKSSDANIKNKLANDIAREEAYKGLTQEKDAMVRVAELQKLSTIELRAIQKQTRRIPYRKAVQYGDGRRAVAQRKAGAALQAPESTGLADEDPPGVRLPDISGASVDGGEDLLNSGRLFED